MPVYGGSYWTLDTDWLVDSEDSCLRPENGAAELRIDVLDYGSSNTWKEVLATARSRASSVIEQAACGQFAGVTYAVNDEEGLYCREWLLCLAELLLRVNFRCPVEEVEELLRLVVAMLATLRDHRA